MRRAFYYISFAQLALLLAAILMKNIGHFQFIHDFWSRLVGRDLVITSTEVQYCTSTILTTNAVPSALDNEIENTIRIVCMTIFAVLMVYRLIEQMATRQFPVLKKTRIVAQQDGSSGGRIAASLGLICASHIPILLLGKDQCDLLDDLVCYAHALSFYSILKKLVSMIPNSMTLESGYVHSPVYPALIINLLGCIFNISLLPWIFSSPLKTLIPSLNTEIIISFVGAIYGICALLFLYLNHYFLQLFNILGGNSPHLFMQQRFLCSVLSISASVYLFLNSVFYLVLSLLHYPMNWELMHLISLLMLMIIATILPNRLICVQLMAIEENANVMVNLSSFF